MSFPEPYDYKPNKPVTATKKKIAMRPVGQIVPNDDLHTLIEFGYASKDRAIREALAASLEN